jgi:hypothetical protein
VTDTPPTIPTIVAHYAAYLRAKTKLNTEISMKGDEASLTIGSDDRHLTLAFTRRKQKWLLRRIEVRRGDETRSFTQGELAKAIAALLGRTPLTSAQPAVTVNSGPRTDATLRERRNTVIRV